MQVINGKAPNTRKLSQIAAEITAAAQAPKSVVDLIAVADRCVETIVDAAHQQPEPGITDAERATIRAKQDAVLETISATPKVIPLREPSIAPPLKMPRKDKLPIPPRRLPTPQVPEKPAKAPKAKPPKKGSAEALKAAGKLRSAPVPATPVEMKAALKAAAEPHPLDIPEALKVSREQRAEERKRAIAAPRTSPGREMAVPARKMPTKAELAEKAKKLGLTQDGKPKRKAKPGKAAKPRKPGSEPKKGSKTAIVAGLLKRKGGCTTADILTATGWPSVSVPAMAAAAGLKLAKTKKPGEPTRYTAE